jgi:ABC-type uncharacterized transport system substrate-binding protein
VAAALTALAAAAVAVAPSPVQAHPHVWVTASATLNFAGSFSADSLALTLILDEMTSAFLLEGLDADGNGVYDRQELRDLAKENATSLAEFGWFTELVADGAPVGIREATGYDYRYEGDRMVLILELALARAVDLSAEKVELRLYDPSFYVLVELDEAEPIRVDGVAPELCHAEIGPPTTLAEGVSLSDTMLEALDPSANVGRDYAEVVVIGCGPEAAD